tara:strand:+ start:28857 stop:29153 length:297 start_codon:yes stop_codon:yes gene_type:complete
VLKLSKIKGYSMSPSYLEGDYVVSVTTKLVNLRIGDIIIFKHPAYGYLIKEICQKNENGYYVQGIYPKSTTSESIGLVNLNMIEGKVIMKIQSKTKLS